MIKMTKKALFLYTDSSTFVRGDFSTLKKNYDVDFYHFKNSPKWLLPLSLLKELKLLFTLHRYQFIYIWFADYHSFLPLLLSKLYRKKSFLVIGGYDIAREREFNYGSFTKPLRAFMTLSSIKWASCNLAVSQNVERTLKGIAPKANITTLYNGVILGEPSSEKRGGKGVLTVALVRSRQALYIKGIDRLNSVATLLPSLQFRVVGCSEKVFRESGLQLAPNLELIEEVKHYQLRSYYQEADLYCQLSRRESFSLSLAEAMSYNLPPIISTAGGMPEVIGSLGYSHHYIKGYNNEREVAQLIEKALLEKKKSGSEESYRTRIKEKFSLEIRENSLLSLIEKYLKK